MTCEDCKFYEKECDVHFHQELMGRKRVLKICEIFYPKKPRFIEANILVNDLLEAEANGGMGTVVARTLVRYVKRSKTVDAVEVVRCEHCVHSLGDGWICGGPSFTMPSHPTYPDAFCSYGERKGHGI